MKNIFIILLLFTLISCVGIRQKRNLIPVQAGHIYKGEYINIRAPNSDGWYLVNSSPGGMEFARRGLSKNETFAAQLLIFPLPEMKSNDEFISLVKKSIQADINTGRYEEIKTEYAFTNKRNYPCVKVVSTVNDKQSKVSGNSLETLILQSNSLYCRHPVRVNTGFSAIYSHRGYDVYEPLDKEASDYIEGIQVPEHAK